MLFENNAKVGEKYFNTTLGVLKPGASADIIVMDYKPFTPFSGDNIDGHMIFGMTGRQCQTTIGNGKILMKDPGAGRRGRGSRQRPYPGGVQEAVGRAEPHNLLLKGYPPSVCLRCSPGLFAMAAVRFLAIHPVWLRTHTLP